MSILNKVKKLSASLLAFEKHPARQLDLEQKFHYLNGLALVMLEDEKIEESEKEYLKTLLTSLDISEEHLDNLIEFAQSPSDEALKDMLKAIEEMKELKYVFLLDALVLANYDGNLDEDEKGLIEEFAKLLKIKKDVVEKLEYLEKLIRERDKLALYRFFLGKYPFDVEIFNYLLDFFKIKKEELLKEYVDDVKKKIKFSYNKLFNEHYKIPLTFIYSDSPITVKTYSYFLQYLFDKNELEIIENDKIVNSNGEIILLLDKNDITIKNGTIYSNSTEYVKVTLIGAKLFLSWLREVINADVYFTLLFFGDEAGVSYSVPTEDIMLLFYEVGNSFKGIFNENEIILVEERNGNRFVKYKDDKLQYIKNDDSELLFRVYKIEEKWGYL